MAGWPRERLRSLHRVFARTPPRPMWQWCPAGLRGQIALWIGNPGLQCCTRPAAGAATQVDGRREPAGGNTPVQGWPAEPGYPEHVSHAEKRRGWQVSMHDDGATVRCGRGGLVHATDSLTAHSGAFASDDASDMARRVQAAARRGSLVGADRCAVWADCRIRSPCAVSTNQAHRRDASRWICRSGCAVSGSVPEPPCRIATNVGDG